MRRKNTQTLEVLRQHRSELSDRGVKSLALFGSTVRGEARPDSDVDVLVELNRPMGIFEFLRLRYRLEEILGRRVDLVTEKALKRQLRDHILKDIKNAGQKLEISP
ncbi:MAG: nucleotidyltransferase family protein [Deltaproteobacteria bacterium]|nr:nucleotidyltransferase family protein [Deltaproteobacteria bacterium]